MMQDSIGRDYERTKGRFVLECHHDIVFSKPWPKVGEEVYCVKCNDVKPITLVPKRVARKMSRVPV